MFSEDLSFISRLPLAAWGSDLDIGLLCSSSCSLLVDIDECDERHLTGCADCSVATCANRPGSYSCTCKHGFVGNGTHCRGVRLRLFTSICSIIVSISRHYDLKCQFLFAVGEYIVWI